MALSTAAAGVLSTLGSSLIGIIPNLISSIGNSSSASSSQSSTTQTSAESREWATYGASDTALASILNALGSTPTGNNSNSAAEFNQASATTANNLQSTWMNQANVINGISNTLANLQSLYSQSTARSYNEKQSEITREWQQMMRQTAYQDTVSDLQAAGLNPILAAKNGATGNYTGAEAQTQALQGLQTTAAAIPSAHTANMQAMYDYGNNTSQYLNMALQTVNNAKQYGYENIARQVEESMGLISQSSAQNIEQLSRTNPVAETASNAISGLSSKAKNMLENAGNKWYNNTTSNNASMRVFPEK